MESMKHYLYAMGAIFCWASLPVATDSGLEGLTTEELMFFSFVSAALYLYIQDVLSSRSFDIYIPGTVASVIGVSGIFLYHYTYYTALSYTPLAEGAILTTTWSFWIVVFSSILIFRRIRMSIICIAAIGMLGAAMVIAADKDLSFDLGYMKGYLLALLCGLIWSTFSLALGYIKVKKEPMTTFTIYAALLSIILYIMSMPHDVPPPKALFSAIYLGCIPLGLSFFLWNRAVTGGNMVIIGFLSYLTPPLAVLFVALVYGQKVSNQVLLGMLVIIGASISGRLLLKEKNKKQVQ